MGGGRADRAQYRTNLGGDIVLVLQHQKNTFLLAKLKFVGYYYKQDGSSRATPI